MPEESTEYDRYYECRDCRHRMTTEKIRTSCPECGGALRNIAVPRE